MINRTAVVMFLLCASASAQGHLHKVGAGYVACKIMNCTCTRYALDYLLATGCIWGAEAGDTLAEVQAAYDRMSQTQTRLSGLVGGTAGAHWDSTSPIYCIAYQRGNVAGGVPATQGAREVQSLSVKMTESIEARLRMLKLHAWEQYQRDVKPALEAPSVREYLQLIIDTQERLAKLNGFFTNQWTYMATAAPQVQSVRADVDAVQYRWTQLSPEVQKILSGHPDKLR